MTAKNCLFWIFVPGFLWENVFAYPDRVERTKSNSSGSSCRISLDLQGMWYQKHYPEPLAISERSFNEKGECVKKKLNTYYLFHLKTERSSCYRCIIFFPIHENVVQYKESQCITEDSIEKACNMLYSDLPLVYLFRADAQAVPCPIRGPLNFTYESANEACVSRKSTVDGCASNTLVQFRYEACPEASASMSHTRTDKYQCFGTWSKGSLNFFAAKLLDDQEMNAAENFRCFAYTKTSSGGKIGISADASCRELVDVDSAHIKISFERDSYPAPSCTFVHWLRHYHHDKNRKKVWESMTSHSIHTIGEHQWIVSDRNTQENQSVMTCIQAENLGKVAEFVVYKADNCDRGYYCLKAYRRDNQVMETIMGKMAQNPFEACTSMYFSDKLQVFDTFVLMDSVEKRCPNHGRYKIHGCTEDTASVSFGCTRENQLIVSRHCSKDQRETYNCHGHWEEAGVHYLVLKEQHTGKKLCYVYSKRGEVLSVSGFYRHPCRLGVLPGVNNRLVHSFTATASGEFCQPSSAALSNTSSSRLVSSFPFNIASKWIILTVGVLWFLR